jgi:CPA2 family monovalent cation:H+ antiporter-2
MGDALIALGGAFLVAGFLARLGRRVGLPTIPLFMLAGLLCGPNTPGIELISDPAELEPLASLGLIMLLFYLGLEFSTDDLVGGGRNLLAVGGIYLALNVGGGLAFGFALGWGSPEALVIAGVVGISSSAMATKLLTELHRLANPESRTILGIIVVEDVFLAMYLAVLQPIVGEASDAADVVSQILVAFLFLVALATLARYGAGLVNRLLDTPDDELLTICFVGLAIFVAGAAEEIGVSDAIGAFMVGLVLAESPSKPRIERLVLPLRDSFAALFFFAFGLTIDPGDTGAVLVPVLIAVVMSGALNVAAGFAATRIYAFRPGAALNIAFTILGRGEFALILAALAAEAGLDARVTSFVALYVLVLAVVAPVLAGRSERMGSALERRLARRADARREAVP